MAAEKKGNSVSTETFKSWEKDNIFGVLDNGGFLFCSTETIADNLLQRRL